jgi:hypothetical protein
MAFVRIKPKKSTGRGAADSVSMGAYLADGKDISRKSVVFRFSRSVVEQLGWDKEGTTAVVLEGTDTDVGFLQITPDPAGYSVTGKSTKSAQSRGITVAIDRFQHYILNEAPVPTMPVQFMVEGDTLIVECPEPVADPPPQPTRVVSRDEQFADLVADVKPMPKPKLQLHVSAMRSDTKAKRPYKR